MSRSSVEDLPRPLFQRLHLLFVALVVGVSAISALGALKVVDRSVQRLARADIEAEYLELGRYQAQFKVVSIADAIDFRVSLGPNHPTIYLLARADGSPVVGSLARWPPAVPIQPGWYRFNLESQNEKDTEVLGKVALVDNEFPILVARPLSVYTKLKNEFLPLLLGSIGALAAILLMVVIRAHRSVNQRIVEINSVLVAAGKGRLNERLDESATSAGDEIAFLARQINDTLSENARLVNGLDTVSQTAAHEINKELSLLRDVAASSNQQELVASSENLLTLLREILELSKVDSSADAMMILVDLGVVVDDAVALYQDAFEDASIRLSTQVDPVQVLGQAHLLTNSVANLLSNALHHAPAGGEVLVRVHVQNSSATISVTDDGPGTESNDIHQILERKRSGTVAGYGFGLRFVQAVAIRHGAKFRLTNLEPGLRVSLTFSIEEV